MNVTLNKLNLTTGYYKLIDIQFDSSPPLQFSDLAFASSDGAKFISSRFTPKTLTLTGIIQQTTVALLEAEMDNFKKTLLSDPNINLNFSYANSFRQYVGNVQNLTLSRKAFNLTYVPFEITFIAEDPPFAYDISTIGQLTPNLSEVFSADGVTGNTYSHTLSFSGTAQPLAKWTYMLDTVSGRIEQIVFKSLTTGKQMKINSALSAGDEIIIDEESLKVTLNNFANDYEGVFPTFNLGGNEFEWLIYGTTSEKLGIFTDQTNNVGPFGYYNAGGFETGQTFTAGDSNILGKISLLTLRIPGFTPPTSVTYRLYNTSGGLPTGSALATVVVTGFDTVTQWLWSWLDINFNYSSVVSGTKYAITSSFSDGYLWYGITTNKYTDGNMVLKSGTWQNIFISYGYDWAFVTYNKAILTSVFNHESSIKLEQKKRFL